MAKVLNSNDFDNVIKEGVTLVDFYADWCGPCQMIAPTIEQLANERTDANICKVDTEVSPEIAQKFGVMSIPTLIVFKDGKEFNRIVGVNSKDQLNYYIDGALNS